MCLIGPEEIVWTFGQGKLAVSQFYIVCRGLKLVQTLPNFSKPESVTLN